MGNTNMDIPDLPEFLRILDRINRDLPKQTQEKAPKEVARDWISAARNRASRPSAVEVANQMQVGNAMDGAQISNSAKGFFGEEFGGRAKPSTMMFPPHQGQRGYWLFPAARANADKLNRIWEAAVDDATKSWKN